MRSSLGTTLAGLFHARDELSIRNLRFELWPFWLIFPLTIIVGDLRYFDINVAVASFESYELMLFPLGLGWLVSALIPKRQIIPFLRNAALASAVLLPFQIFMPGGMGHLALFMAFQFFNGLCAACAFSLFCFLLNNVERLFGMVMVQIYYGFYYTVWRAFPSVASAGKTWGSAVVMVLYLFVVFSLTAASPRKCEGLEDTVDDGKGSPVLFIIVLDIAYYIIMCMINYIEWAENSVSSLMFGLGSFLSVALVIIIQLLNNRSALYVWPMFLTLSLLGLGALLYDSPVTLLSGSFAYGLGDGLGYITIYYILSAAVKKSKSFRMFRLCCIKFFGEYFLISGIFSILFKYVNVPNKFAAFAIILVLSSFFLLLMPYMQRKLFEVDWTDGLSLSDMAEYSDSLSEVKTIDAKDNLNLTSREQEIFTMLLTSMSPKEIAFTIKISFDTVRFHQKNLYRKLGIQSRSELFAKYSAKNIQNDE